jgi:hypothetical protein
VHLDDDIAVFARSVLAYRKAPTQVNLALSVLAQRVLYERGRSLRRPNLTKRLHQTVESINESVDVAREWAAKPPRGSLVRVYPLYAKAGLAA